MSNSEIQHQYDEVLSFMNTFYKNYYTARDFKKVAGMAADHIVFVGLSSNEIFHNKSAFIDCVKDQMFHVPEPIEYFIHDYRQINSGHDLWTCGATISLRVTNGNWGIVRYVIRLMTTVAKENGHWQIISMYVSEASEARRPLNAPKFATEYQDVGDFDIITRKQLEQLVDHIIPGGVIARVNSENYPIAVANRQYLKMCGFSSMEEYCQVFGSAFLHSIHPDDEEKFLYTANFISATGKQYECDYRLQRKDGSFLWVHDVGCRAVSVEGKEIIVSIITDMSRQVEKRHQLEMENGIDFLTQVYNRRGAKDRMDQIAGKYQRYILFIVDLDNFKLVNDLYGHAVGDEVLKYIANLFRSTFTNNCIVCRFGGDEFSIFIPNYQRLDDLIHMLHELASTYRAFTEHVCPNANTALSIGGIYGTRDISTREKYRIADANLYKIKNGQKGNICFTDLDSEEMCCPLV